MVWKWDSGGGSWVGGGGGERWKDGSGWKDIGGQGGNTFLREEKGVLQSFSDTRGGAAKDARFALLPQFILTFSWNGCCWKLDAVAMLHTYMRWLIPNNSHFCGNSNGANYKPQVDSMDELQWHCQDPLLVCCSGTRTNLYCSWFGDQTEPPFHHRKVHPCWGTPSVSACFQRHGVLSEFFTYFADDMVLMTF